MTPSQQQVRRDRRMLLRGFALDELTAEELEANPPPANPLSREFLHWNVGMMIGREQALIERHGLAALEALALCLGHQIIPPPWLVESFITRLKSFQRFEAASLDEAFDVPPLKSKSRQERARAVKLIPEIERIGDKLLRQDPSRPVDASLFEAIAEQIGSIAASKCEKLYYEALQRDEIGSFVDLKKTLQFAQKLSRKHAKT